MSKMQGNALSKTVSALLRYTLGPFVHLHFHFPAILGHQQSSMVSTVLTVFETDNMTEAEEGRSFT